MKHTQKYIGFFAAILSIVACALYWHATGRYGIDQAAADTSTGLGNGFFVVSIILWAVYIIIAIVIPTKRSKKDPTR